MDLSIITVTWNSKDLIGTQIKSVFSSCNNISYEYFLVDNASTDGTADAVQSNFPAVTVIANLKNEGFGHANNQGAQLAEGDFLLFLNPDMRVAPGSLDVMVAYMRMHADVGIASCKLVDEKGRISEDAKPRRFPTVWNQAAIVLKVPHLFPCALDSYRMKDFNPDKEQDVDSVRGSFMLVRRALYEKLGWAFDPRYFIWFEDVDLCREAKRHGYCVTYTPIATCVDYVGQSFKKRDSVWKQTEFTKSMVQYFQKWAPRWQYALIRLLRPVGIFMARVGEKLHRV